MDHDYQLRLAYTPHDDALSSCLFFVEGLFQKLNLFFQPRNIGLGEMPAQEG